MTDPKVTVLMCVHNGEPFLAASIQSILDQTFRDFELLILDDGSTDNSAGVVQGFSDPRIRFIQNPTCQGLTAARNRCLDLARGTYIAIQDADDLASPTRLEVEVQALDSDPDLGLVGTWIQYIDAHDQPVELYGSTVFQPLPEPNRLKWTMLFQCDIAHASAMYRKALALDAGGYGNYPYGEDYDLFCRINRLARVKNLPEILQCYRQSPTSVTHTLSPTEKHQCNLRIMQANLERLLGETFPSEVAGHMRAYRIPSLDSPCVMEAPTTDRAAVTRTCASLYHKLYDRFLSENHPPPSVKAFIQNDITAEILRHLFKLPRLSRTRFVLQHRKTLPPFCVTRCLLISALFTQGQFHALVQTKHRLHHLLGRSPYSKFP